MKKLFTFMLLLLGVVQSTYAQEPYAVLSNGNTTLTFYYDNNKEAKGGMDVGPFTQYNSSGWYDQRSNIKTVVFDDSFAGCTSITSTAYWFYDCENLIKIKHIENLNTTNVTSMSNMFYLCSNLIYLDLSNFNTTNVTDMNYMFSRCSRLTYLDLSNFNTKNVTNMGHMFFESYNLTYLDLSNFNTTNAYTNWMFAECSRLTKIYCNGTWTNADAGDSEYMFENCLALKGAISYDSEKTDITYANSTDGYFTTLDKVIPRPYAKLNSDKTTLTFYYGKATGGFDIGQFRIDYSIDYYSGGEINSGWDEHRNNITTVVFDKSFADYADFSSTAYWFYRFSNLSAVNGIENLNTGNVTDMNSMFYGCSSLTNLDVNHFNTTNVTSMSSMFYGCSGLTGLDMSSFNTANVTSMSSMFYNCSSLESIDVSSFNTTKAYYMADMFYGCSSLTNLDVSNFNTENVSSMSRMFFGCSSLTNLDVSKFNTAKVTSMDYMFYGCSGLTNLDLSNFNTTNVANMTRMFECCSGLTNLDLSIFNTDKVISMYRMFCGCSNLTNLDVSKFNTAKVTDMGQMFTGCSNLTSLDVSNFNTANVTDMSFMFFNCSSLESIDVSNFNTANVTSMSSMFSGCSSLTSLDVSKFNTANVTSMGSMFLGCSSLTSLDVSNFDTKKVWGMYDMFNGCSNLTTIYCNDTWSCSSSTDMFKDCTSLVGAISYDANKTDVTYANPTTGYFTEKTGGEGKVILSKTEAFIEKGKTLTLKATVTPETLEDKSVTWTSSDTKIATVSSAGKVKGVKTGTATITCTSNATGKKATCKVTVGSVKLDQTEIVVEKTKTKTLTATVYPSTLTDKSVTWTSSNTAIATVSSKGKVKGVKTGTVTITCTSNATGLSTTCKVTVGSVKLDQTEAFVEKGKTVTLKATAYPSTLEDKTVTWTSSNTAVATVSSKGKVKGVRTGTATITCTSNATGLSATCEVTVGSVKLDQTEVAVNKGETVTLKATVYPSTLEDKTVTWTSSNTAVATVSSKGKVKGVRTGTATITCTSNATGLSTTCEVTVGSVILDQTEVTVKKDKTVTLKATVYPSTLADKSVTWKSSNTSIATVTAEGKVKGIKAGTATITCTSVATGLSATCTVTVTSTSGSRSMEGDDDELTGIEENVVAAEPFDVYDLSGRKVLHQVTSLDGLPDGIYIVNGKKILKKK